MGSTPAPTATPALQYRVVVGQIAAVNRSQRSISLAVPASADTPGRTWQVALSEGTAITRQDGTRIGFEEVGIADQVEVSGFEAPAPRTPTASPAPAGTLLAAQVRVLVSAVPPSTTARPGTNVLVLLDGVENLRTPQYGFTGDWLKRLTETGYAVTAMDPARIRSGANLNGFALIVIGYPATLSESALAAVKASKLPILNADPRLVQPLGLGLNVDPAQPTRMVAGKKVEIEGQASPVTRGFSGEVDVANDTLYRTPIIANGTVLGSITEGGRKLAVWSLTGNVMYFGFWWSASGQNHNATYWALFDRSVLFLLGRDPQSVPPPTGRPAA
jgi:hypothetical protein